MDNLSKLLKKCKVSGHDFKIYQVLELKARNVLKFFPAHACYHTEHGGDHSARIIENLDRLLANGAIKKLNELEAFILLCSAWLHDIGYVVNEKNGKNLTDEEIQDQHHELSEYFIMKHYAVLGLEDKPTASLIARICASHRRKISIEDKLPIAQEGLKGKTVRPQFLASLLSLADALDTDTRRAPEIRSRYVTRLPEDSQLHWKVCDHIGGFMPDRKSACLMVDANYTSKANKDLILWKLEHLQGELDRVSTILIINDMPYHIIIGRLKKQDKVYMFDMMKQKQEKAVNPYDPTKYLDITVVYSIDIGRKGNAWLKRETSFLNTSKSLLKERVHKAYSTDSNAKWDWKKHIIIDYGGSIRQIVDEPMHKEFAIVFPGKGIPANKKHDYAYRWYWPGIFREKNEWLTTKDTSTKVTYNLILPKDLRLKNELRCIECFPGGWAKKCKIRSKKEQSVRGGKISYSISVEKEDRLSGNRLEWEVK